MKQTKETGTIAIRLLVVIALVLGQLTIAASAYSEEGLEETTLEETTQEETTLEETTLEETTLEETTLEETTLEETTPEETTLEETTLEEENLEQEEPDPGNPPCEQTGNETVVTDKADYSPGETVHVAGDGYAPECEVAIKITRPNGTVVKGDGTFLSGMDAALTGGDGTFAYAYQLNGIEGEYLVEVLGLDGVVLASVTFLDGSVLFVTNSVASGHTSGAAAGSITINKPSSVTPGQLMLAHIAIDGGSGVAITPPTGWTLVPGARSDNGASVGHAVYYKFAGAAEPSSYQWTFDSATAAVAGFASYWGVDEENPVRDVGAAQTGTTTGTSTAANTLTAPSVEVSNAAGAKAVSFFTIDRDVNTSASTGGMSPPSGSAERWDINQPSSGGPPSASGAEHSSIPATGNTGARTSVAGASASGTAWVAQQIVLNGDQMSNEAAVTSGTLNITPPPGVQEDDFLLAQLSYEGGTNVTAFSASGWTFLRRDDASSNVGSALFWKFATDSEPISYPFSYTGGGSKKSGGILAYRGVDSEDPIADHSGAGATNQTSTAIAPEVTTTADDSRLAFFAAIKGNRTVTVPTGMRQRYQVRPPGDLPTSAAGDEIQASAGASGTKSAPFTGGDETWTAQLVALTVGDDTGNGGDSATITVHKEYDPEIPNDEEPVDLTLECTGDTVVGDGEPGDDTEQATSTAPAVFAVTGFGEEDTCTVVEDPVPSGYSATYGTGDEDDCDGEGEVPLADEGDYVCTVTNTLNSASVTVYKDFSDKDGTDTTEVDIDLDCGDATVSPEAGDKASEAAPAEFTVTGFVDGVDECTVTEDPVPTGYTESYGGEDCDEDGDFTLSLEQVSYECTVTNALNSADVTVSKDFSDDSTDEVDISLDCGDADVDPASDTASEATAAEFTVTGFEDDDTCTVEEDVPSGYTASFEDTEDDCDAEGVITLAVDGEYACEITNTLNEADLTVSKEYSDGNTDEVTINLECDSGDITPSDQEDTVGLEVTFTITGFATGDTCTATEDDVPAGYAANDADCAGVELTPGTPASCTIYNVQSIALMSQGSCSFDRDADRPRQQFPLIYTPDSGSTWKLNASNPGQFFLNVAYSGVSEDLEIEIPYPFVTVGANPVRVYEDVTTRVNGAGKTCFSPEGLIRTQDNQITWDWGTDDFGDEDSIGVDVPESGFVYVRIHLTYGLKRIATSCGKGTVEAGLTALDAVCVNPLAGGATIKTYQPYDFSFYGDTADGGETIESFNVFKRDPGIGGQLTLGSNGDPLGNTKVEIWLDGNKVDTLTTDVDGWYISPFKHKGKAATYKVKLPTYGEERSATVKANTFVIVNFDVGSILSGPPLEGGGNGDGDGGTSEPPPTTCVPKGKSKSCA